MLQIRAKILYNKRVKGNYFHLILNAPGIAGEARPGQFLNIRVSENYEPLLRRPFSISRVKGSNAEVFYEVLGEGTEMLSRKKPGEDLDVIGPLGNGFDYRTAKHLPVLVAGGVGIAPLIFLAEKLVELKTKKAKRKTLVLLGARTKSQILCEKEFKDLGCEVRVATDDGSRGFKGKVTELLKKFLPLAISNKPLAIYACGPRPMLKEIDRISKKYRIPAQVSLEEHLACGIGACLGCAVKTKGGFQRVCKEGPVFNADTIIW